MTWLQLVNNLGMLIIGGMILFGGISMLIRVAGIEKRKTSEKVSEYSMKELDTFFPMIRKEIVETFKELKKMEEEDQWRKAREREYRTGK